jgi:hypothetical protein
VTTDDFAAVMAYLVGAYPEARPTPATLAVYRQVLLPLSADAVMAAAEDWIEDHRGWPTVADLLAGVRRRSQPATGPPPDPGPTKTVRGRYMASLISAWARGQIGLAEVLNRTADLFGDSLEDAWPRQLDPEGRAGGSLRDKAARLAVRGEGPLSQAMRSALRVPPELDPTAGGAVGEGGR